MLPQERQQGIVSHLGKCGFTTVAELCEMFSVSEMTIRRDLDELQKQGLLKRTYGGAAATESAFFEVSLRAKMAQFVGEKERIGKAAADMVRDGHTVLLSGGSTTFQVAKDLKRKRITVVTNALNIASELLTSSQIKILVVGGILSQSSACSVGPQAVAFLQEVRADILFLGVEGIDISGGLTVPDVIEAHTDKAMVKSAGQTVVVADHSKLGRNALSTIAPIDGVDLIISDKGAPEHIVEQLRAYVKIHLV